jgi:outer membrane lipoprotein carrier protein
LASPRHLCRVIAPLALILCATVSTADGEQLQADQVVAGLQRWLDGTTRLEGRFEQRLVSGALGSEIEETGKLYLERPGKMRWDYIDPERKIALVVGDKTWLYLEEEEQLFIGRLDEQGGLLPRLLAGEGVIAEDFHAALLDESSPPKNGSYLLQLTPRGAEESFENVVLLLRPPRFAIEAAEVLDAAGNRVSYRFFALRRNRTLPSGLFRFEPPEGTLISGAQ